MKIKLFIFLLTLLLASLLAACSGSGQGCQSNPTIEGTTFTVTDGNCRTGRVPTELGPITAVNSTSGNLKVTRGAQNVDLGPGASTVLDQNNGEFQWAKPLK